MGLEVLQAQERDLLEERKKPYDRAHEIQQLGETQKRNLTDEEKHNLEEAFNSFGELTDRLNNVRKLLTAGSEMTRSQGVSNAATGDLGNIDPDVDLTNRKDNDDQVFRQIDMVRGFAGNYEQRTAARDIMFNQRYSTPQLNHAQAFRKFLLSKAPTYSDVESRALQMDDQDAGGYIVAPERFQNTLIQAIDDIVYLRQWATVQTVSNAQTLGVPSLDNDPADPDWTGEITAAVEDTTMDFGKRAFTPHPLSKLIKVSNTLLQRSTLGPEAIVRERLAYKFGTTQENAFQSGDGAGQPLGLFTASADGIPTSRDSDTGSTTGFTMDGLILAKYQLKAGYWNRARWLVHRDGARRIAQLKDSNNNYLWRESVRAGEPDRLLGRPIFMSEFTPNTFTAALYVGMLADFSFYWIVDALTLSIIRLNELYAATFQTGYIGRMESDGMPVLGEAFVRLKTDAS